jgi:hypothetical protein
MPSSGIEDGAGSSNQQPQGAFEAEEIWNMLQCKLGRSHAQLFSGLAVFSIKYQTAAMRKTLSTAFQQEIQAVYEEDPFRSYSNGSTSARTQRRWFLEFIVRN